MKNISLLGTVDIITRAKLILVRIDKPDRIPTIGCKVLDTNGVEVGKIVDVIGPVNRPYAVVKPSSCTVLSTVKQSTVLFYKSIREKRFPRRGARK
ncbi:MAG: hypothetical protein QW775_00780 [Ignisphaera sp.]|uniref:RNA-binding protein n=1 Tax=Ignisphaera aggregans TaxID=334771 RepID=A0A7C4NLB2_9CREN